MIWSKPMHCAIALALALQALNLPATAREPADFVLTGGQVQTLDAKGTVAQAVAIRGEKLVFVGSDEGAKAHVGPKTLRKMTVDAAWPHFDESRKGTLEVGKLGDLAVLDADYFTCPEEQI